MRDELVHIAWTAAPLSDAQQMVLRNIAILMILREDPTLEFVDFTHLLVEGRLYLKSRGVFVTLAGTFFHADLGTVGGVRWTCDFLLPAGTEREDFSKGILRRGSDGMTVAIDPSLTRTGPESLLT